jgi:hypothetical protein
LSLSSACLSDILYGCSTQGIAYVPNRMATLDYDNKLIGIANNTDKTTWGGIAHRNDNGAFLAVQERRLSNSSSKALAIGFETLCTYPSRVIYTCLCTPFWGIEAMQS